MRVKNNLDLPKNLHKIIQDLTASLSLKDIELAGKDLQIEILTAENKRLLAEFFGRSSERHTGNDAEAFDEKNQPEKDPEADPAETADVNADADESVETEDIAYTRKKKGGKSGRKPLPEYLYHARSQIEVLGN